MEHDDEKRIEMLNRLTLRTKACFDILPIGNLTLNEISSLTTIYKGQNEKGELLNMSEAGELLGLGRSAMSQLVARLERKGMLKREIVPWDRRKTLIKLTAKTKNYVDKIKNHRISCMKKVIDIVGKEDIDEFIRLFQKFMEAVEEATNA